MGGGGVGGVGGGDGVSRKQSNSWHSLMDELLGPFRPRWALLGGS